MNASWPFDEVRIADVPPITMTASEFFALPLAKRVRYVIAKSAVFFAAGVEVDAADALAQLRTARAAS
jgi:hypothetical protein